MKRTVWIAALAAVLALSACDDPANSVASQERTERAPPQLSRMLMADGAAISSKSSPSARMEMGRTYALEIINGEVGAAMEADRAVCLKLECVVTSVNTSRRAGHPTASLRALVPQDKATEFHNHIMNAADREVTSFNETANNRGDQYQNIKARLERLEFMRKRLYALAEKKSDKVGELLQVEREMLRVDTDIERLTRQRHGVEKVTDNVTFTLNYSQRPPKAGDVDFSPFTGLLSDTVNTFLQAVRTTFLWIARWLPTLLLVGIVLLVMWRRRGV